MEALGYVTTVIVAGVLAVGGGALLARSAKIDWRQSAYLFLLSLFGVYAGSELFGEIGSIESLSQHGPSIGGFYILTGLVGGVVMAAAGTYSLMRAAKGRPTDIAAEGISDPKVAHFLFNDTRSAPLWLGIRLFVGFEWLAAGWHKITDPAWMDSGTALKGFWTSATAIPQQGNPRVTYDWYRDFLTYMLNHEWYTWFAKLVAIGEFLIGIGLIVGLFVGIAAFFGSLLNFNFMLAGTASTNPVLFGLAVFLVLAWKVAGHFGLDRYALPLLGAPWSPGRAFSEAREHGRPSPAA